MMYRRFTIGACAILLVLLAVACGGVKGSGTAASEMRTVGAFDEVQLSDVLRLELTMQKKVPRLEISGDDNLVPLVTTVVKDGRLIIGTGKKGVRPDLPLVVKVEVPNVSVVRGSGVVKIELAGVDNEKLTIKLNGASKAKVAGKSRKLEIDAHGATNIDARKLASEEVEIELTGAARVKLGAPKKLNVEIAGAGSVYYSGDPEIKKSISGSGSLKKR